MLYDGRKMDIFDVNVDDFKDKVISASSERPILVDFWAAWCSPCHVIAPVLEKVVSEYEGSLGLAKLEVDAGENMKLAGHYLVRGFPTIILFYNGEEAARFSGAKPQQAIERFLDENLVS